MINSIAKGKRGERDIVHLLNNITGVIWNRVPCSGALFTSAGKKGRDEFKGDVYCNDEPYCRIVVEVKNTKGSVKFNDMFSDSSPLGKWKQQLMDESEGQKGILFFKSKGKWCYWIKYSGSNDVLGQIIFNKLRSVSQYVGHYGIIHKSQIPPTL